MGVVESIPHNLEAERAVRGGLLLAIRDDRGDLVTAAIGDLGEEAFYSDAHRAIWRAICAVQTAGLIPDLVTVTDYLRRRGELEQVGGAKYLTSLLDATAGPFMLPQHVSLVRRDWWQRVLADGCGEIRPAALNRHDPAALLPLAEKILAA